MREWPENNIYDETGRMMLSIVMATIPERWEQFTRLRDKIQVQIDYCRSTHPALGKVEIVEVNTPTAINGGPSIGKKRQMGLDESKGEYVCWLDDDDDISPDYVETLLRLAMKNRDVLTFSSFSRFDRFWCVVQMSNETPRDEQVRPGIVKRRPWHVCAFKRNLANKVSFPHINWDEDTVFIDSLLPLCKNESHTDAIIHEYNRLTTSYSWG